MGTEGKILLWWILFGGTHLLGSTAPVRDFLLRTLRLRGFKAVYSLIALATFLPLCFAYFTNKHAGPLLFTPPESFRPLTQVLLFLFLLALTQGLAAPSPMATILEISGMGGQKARGILRATRHPMTFGYFLFGIGHCLSNPFRGDWIFFGGFVVFALLGSIHQDRRAVATGSKAVKQFQRETSLIPFAAILAGKQRLGFREYNRFALAAAVILFLILRYFHASLFGGFAT